MTEKEIGSITHYFSHINVGIIQLTDTLKVGDTIHIKGHTTDIQQVVESIQIEHRDVPEAKSGDLAGVKVKDHVRQHDKVYKLEA